jgi:hypothetical protein
MAETFAQLVAEIDADQSGLQAGLSEAEANVAKSAAVLSQEMETASANVSSSLTAMGDSAIKGSAAVSGLSAAAALTGNQFLLVAGQAGNVGVAIANASAKASTAITAAIAKVVAAAKAGSAAIHLSLGALGIILAAVAAAAGVVVTVLGKLKSAEEETAAIAQKQAEAHAAQVKARQDRVDALKAEIVILRGHRVATDDISDAEERRLAVLKKELETMSAIAVARLNLGLGVKEAQLTGDPRAIAAAQSEATIDGLRRQIEQQALAGQAAAAKFAATDDVRALQAQNIAEANVKELNRAIIQEEQSLQRTLETIRIEAAERIADKQLEIRIRMMKREEDERMRLGVPTRAEFGASITEQLEGRLGNLRLQQRLRSLVEERGLDPSVFGFGPGGGEAGFAAGGVGGFGGRAGLAAFAAQTGGGVLATGKSDETKELEKQTGILEDTLRALKEPSGLGTA